MSGTSPPTLRALTRAIERKQKADAEYRAAVIAAAEEVGYAETARIAGITRQAVRQLVLRARRERR